MNMIDKLVNTFSYSDGDNDDYDDYDDGVDEFEEDDAPKKKVFAKPAADLEEEEKKPSRVINKVAPMKQSKKVGGSGMEVNVIKPTSVDASREITDTLLSNRTVVLNLEGLDVDIAQRIIDFASGSTYAIRGQLQKISHAIFILTPPTVDVSGDFQEVLSSAGVASDF